MSRPRKVVTMSKDMFSIYLTLAFMIGMQAPAWFVWVAMSLGS